MKKFHGTNGDSLRVEYRVFFHEAPELELQVNYESVSLSRDQAQDLANFIETELELDGKDDKNEIQQLKKEIARLKVYNKELDDQIKVLEDDLGVAVTDAEFLRAELESLDPQ